MTQWICKLIILIQLKGYFILLLIFIIQLHTGHSIRGGGGLFACLNNNIYAQVTPGVMFHMFGEVIKTQSMVVADRIATYFSRVKVPLRSRSVMIVDGSQQV